MTSEPDNPSHRRPPTIDLTATEVGAERQAAADEAAAGKRAAGRARWNFFVRFMPYAAAAAAGAIAIVAIIACLWLAGYLPAREAAAPASKPEAPDEISARLDRIQGALQAQRPDAALAARLAGAEATTKSLGDSLAALTRRVDDLAAAAQTARAEAKAASTAADEAKRAAQAGIQRRDLDALAGHIAALENAMKALSEDVAHRASSADDRAARLTIAAEALRAAVERGTPFQAELTAVKSFGADQTAIASLEPFAADGVPSTAALADDLAALMPDLLRASRDTSGETTFLGRIETSAQKLVRITPIDAPRGDDPSSVISRINADVARADIAGARADIARLPVPAKSVAEAWTKKAGARDAAIAASRRIAADALAALAMPNPQ